MHIHLVFLHLPDHACFLCKHCERDFGISSNRDKHEQKCKKAPSAINAVDENEESESISANEQSNEIDCSDILNTGTIFNDSLTDTQYCLNSGEPSNSMIANPVSNDDVSFAVTYASYSEGQLFIASAHNENEQNSNSQHQQGTLSQNIQTKRSCNDPEATSSSQQKNHRKRAHEKITCACDKGQHNKVKIQSFLKCHMERHGCPIPNV